MKRLSALLYRFRGIFRRRALNAEMNAEMQAHLDGLIERNLAAGMSPEEARFAALRAFGGVEQAKEYAREQRTWRWLDELAQDLRYAVRQLRRSPGFAIVVVATLALGIGGTTAVYSVVDTVILHPVPGREADRLVQIGQRSIDGKGKEQGAFPPVLEAFTARTDTFADVAWSATMRLERRDEEFPVFESGARVSWNYFRTLQMRPLLGRTFGPADEVPATDAGYPDRDTAIVLSHAWWRSHFGADPQILGRSVVLGGLTFTIVGVMSEYFQFPSPDVRYWIPTTANWRVYAAGGPMSLAPDNLVMARLKPEISLRQAAARVEALAPQVMNNSEIDPRYQAIWQPNQEGLKLYLRPLADLLNDGRGAAEIRRTLFGLFAAVGLVLLIVCANVANLTLARVERRQHELAVRVSLGAGRARLIRQLLTENLLLSFLGGVSGLLLTVWGMKLLGSLSTLPHLRPIALDARVLAVAFGVSCLSAFAFGLAPIWRGSRTSARGRLADGGTGAGWRRSPYHGALVVVQVAVTVVLLSGAGLMMRTVTRLLQVDPGFDPQNILWVNFQLPQKYKTGVVATDYELKRTFYAQLHERLQALPGVEASGFRDNFFGTQIMVEGRSDRISVLTAGLESGESDFFRVMRVPLRAGRYLEREQGGQPQEAVINEAMAQACWPGENALGKIFFVGKQVSWRVVGIVSNLRTGSFTEAVTPEFYTSYRGGGTLISGLALRTRGDPATLAAAVRAELKLIEPNLVRAPTFSSAQTVLFDSTLASRTYRNYLLFFASVGLLLAALGVYGVLAYSVTQRTREIGIRIAIGADRQTVIAMILGDGARLVAVGLVVGVGGAVGLTRLLQSQLFQVSPLDPLVLGGAAVMLAGVALIACWLPALRAAKVDPMVALRTE
jgi:predicted permease